MWGIPTEVSARDQVIFDHVAQAGHQRPAADGHKSGMQFHCAARSGRKIARDQ